MRIQLNRSRQQIAKGSIRHSLPWILLLMLSLITSVTSAQQLEWMRKFGSAGHYDGASGVATDATGVYVIGTTAGPLPGPPAGADLDLYVRKYSFQGKVLWTRQYGVCSVSGLSAIAVDAQGIYVAGTAQTPSYSGFVSRLDLAGNILWTHIFDYQRMTYALSIAVHHTGIYVGGSAGGVDADAVLSRLDFAGNEIWTTPRGIGTTTDDAFTGVTADDTGVYPKNGSQHVMWQRFVRLARQEAQ